MSDIKLSPAAKVLLGEAVGEGSRGMELVADVLYNRAKQTGKNLDEVALAPKQFSAASRPDLDQFVARQPMMLQSLAQQLIAERQKKNYQPQYPGIQHYVARAFYDRRFEPGMPSWIQQMEPVGQVGQHILLAPKKNQ